MRIVCIKDEYVQDVPEHLEQNSHKIRPYYYGFNMGRYAVLIPFRSNCTTSEYCVFLPRANKPKHGLDCSKFILIPKDKVNDCVIPGFTSTSSFRKLCRLTDMVPNKFVYALKLYEETLKKENLGFTLSEFDKKVLKWNMTKQYRDIPELKNLIRNSDIQTHHRKKKKKQKTGIEPLQNMRNHHENMNSVNTKSVLSELKNGADHKDSLNRKVDQALSKGGNDKQKHKGDHER